MQENVGINSFVLLSNDRLGLNENVLLSFSKVLTHFLYCLHTLYKMKRCNLPSSYIFAYNKMVYSELDIV